MKNFRYLLVALLGIGLGSCAYDLDPITVVAPGDDVSAPSVTISYPTEGTLIRIPEEIASVVVKFESTDDIELKSVSVKVDNQEIAGYASFTDYRRVLDELVYDQVTNGDHVLSVTATDKSGKSTTKAVNFSKASPYSPKYTGEKVYFPFDGDLIDLVTTTYPSETGAVGFAGEAKVGSNAFKASEDGYISIPATSFTGSTGFGATFWMKINGSPDRAGILSADFGSNSANTRKYGFRLFRENAGGKQRIKANIGTGASDSWIDGGAAATVDQALNQWVHVALSVSQTEASVYINGVAVKTGTLPAAMDWTGVTDIVFGAGGPSFSYWNHKTDQSLFDELRLYNQSLSAADVAAIMGDQGAPTYVSQFEGETAYLPFDGDNVEMVSASEATVIGATDFSSVAHAGSNSFQGASDSYLTLPAGGLLTSEYSVAFWYKVNAAPTRAGIISIGDNAEDRKQGLRIFREGSDTSQRIKANVGIGTGESWNDGDVIDATTADWVHVAVTISETESTIYLNGVAVRTSALSAPIDWTGCNDIVIGSGGPTFSYWGHNSDLSNIDELRMFNKTLTADEVTTLMNF